MLFYLFISSYSTKGKSTQCPQFLLDANPACNIVVTQPRRISAISIAERVAEEQVQEGGAGGLIGYQVRLDSAVTADTQLVFVTPGILLRKMQSSPQLNEYTHVLIDEIHERDKYQEFLLIVLRDLLPLRPDLRVVLMSATLQTVKLVDFFTSYGVEPAIIEMKGRMFPVQEYFLEQVLEMTGYIDASTGYDGGAKLEKELAKLTGRDQQENQTTDISIQCVLCGKSGFADAVDLGAHIALCDGMLVGDDGDEVLSGADAMLLDQQLSADNEASQFEDYDVDGTYGLEDYEAYGKLQKAPKYEMNESSIAKSSSSPKADSTGTNGGATVDESETTKWDGVSPFDLLPPGADGPTDAEDELLTKYQAMHDDETIDHFLLLEVVQYIVKSSYGDGGILVFLPGWQEISEFSLMLEGTSPFRDRSKFLVLPLHSGIPSRDQRRVLQRPPRGVRKIVLSTNIAETRSVLPVICSIRAPACRSFSSNFLFVVGSDLMPYQSHH